MRPFQLVTTPAGTLTFALARCGGMGSHKTFPKIPKVGLEPTKQFFGLSSRVEDINMFETTTLN